MITTTVTNIEMVDCGVCGRTHENLPQADCRAFKACSKCGDGYLSGEYGPLGNDLTAHEAQCDGRPSMNVIDESGSASELIDEYKGEAQ